MFALMLTNKINQTSSHLLITTISTYFLDNLHHVLRHILVKYVVMIVQYYLYNFYVDRRFSNN